MQQLLHIVLVHASGVCALESSSHGDAFNIARCIAPRAQVPAGPATATEREPLEPALIESMLEYRCGTRRGG